MKKPVRKANKNKYIVFCYVRSSKLTGCNVRLPNNENAKTGTFIYGRYVQKYFKRSDYPSDAKCLADARQWRDDYLEEHNLIHLLKYSISCKRVFEKQKRNSSGVIGICITYYKKPGGVYSYYKATWQEDLNGERASNNKLFSIKKYGMKQAFIKACEVRYQHGGRLIIVNREAIPCLPKSPYRIKK